MFKIQDVEKEFPKAKITKAKKLHVRELEETEKNTFVAFVDEGTESHDVSIKINRNKIEQHTCDCDSKDDFCLHQISVILELKQNQGRTSTNKVVVNKKAKKISESEEILNTLEKEEISVWLQEFFKKNKDAEMQFLLNFSKKQKEYSAKDVAEIIVKTIESVVRKKKNIEASEVKKIVDLLTKSLEPVVEFMEVNILQPISFEIHNAVLETLLDFEGRTFFTSTRIRKFMDVFQAKFAFQINQIHNDEQWKKQAFQYWGLFLKATKSVSIFTLNLIKEIYQGATIERKKILAEYIKTFIQKWIEHEVHLRTDHKLMLLNIMIENGLYKDVYTYFPPARYENEYNIKTLSELVKLDENLAENYIEQIINSNYQEKYNYPYYTILEKIYLNKNDKPKLASLKKKKFEGNPNIEDFIFIEENEIDKREFKKFRTKILGNLRRTFYANPKISEVYFEILEHEKNYTKMLEVLRDDIPSSVILKHAEKLYLTDNEKFLINLSKNIEYKKAKGEDDMKLIDFLISKYVPQRLKTVFRDTFFLDSFSSRLLKKLK